MPPNIQSDCAARQWARDSMDRWRRSGIEGSYAPTTIRNIRRVMTREVKEIT